MAENYFGSFEVPLVDSPFSHYTRERWALDYIVSYGGIDGDHHKSWVIDQVTRILCGTPVVVSQRRWGPSADYPNGHMEWDFSTGEPSEQYLDLVKLSKLDPKTNDPEGYEWNEGIAP